jgi:hypothetical protein
LKISFSRCDENGAGDDGKSDGRCTCELAVRSNMNTDSRHTDNSGRMGAGSTRKDNNSGSLGNRGIRWEIQN